MEKRSRSGSYQYVESRAFVETKIRILITGGSGFLGQFLISHFLDEPGIAEIGYTYKTSPLPNHRVGPTPKGKARL